MACSFAHRLLREAVPPPGLTHGLKSHCEPRRRRRSPEEVMGDEHGGRVQSPDYPCEEPSAPAGFISSRPAGACRRGECRRIRGGFQPRSNRKLRTSVIQRARVTKKRTVAAAPSRSDAAQTGRLFVKAATAPRAIATWKRATVFAKPWWWWRSSSASFDFSSRSFSFSRAFLSISFC